MTVEERMLKQNEMTNEYFEAELTKMLKNDKCYDIFKDIN